jgi:tRNA(Ile2) C34 agmatinyltransferase TiaS
MSSGVQTTGPSVPSLWREVCDKCGTRMELEGRGYGFERWACPYCRQVVAIDRDRQVGGRFQLHRGHPWRWSAQAFRS